MIEINNKQYNKYDIKLTWGTAGKRKVDVPFITFHINDVVIGIEFIFSKEMFLNTKMNIKTNIKNYISDIFIKKGNDWESLMSGEYDCNIERISEKTFNFDFYVKEYVEHNEINIIINENIEIF